MAPGTDAVPETGAVGPPGPDTGTAPPGPDTGTAPPGPETGTAAVPDTTPGQERAAGSAAGAEGKGGRDGLVGGGGGGGTTARSAGRYTPGSAGG
ncbi:hypothetical protein KRM28CT15_00430 [Krasilnikovia sp. M28-CT-15]